MQAIIASSKHGATKVSEVLGVSRASIYRWIKELKEGGLQAIINKRKHQDGFKLTNQHKEKIKEWLLNRPNISINEVKEKLKQYCKVDVSRATVHRAMRSSGFSYITPRKQHYKQNKSAVAEFKKKSTKSN